MLGRLLLFVVALWLLGQWRDGVKLEKAVWLDPGTPSRQTAVTRGWVEKGEDRALTIRLSDGRPVVLVLETPQPLPIAGTLVHAEGKIIAPYVISVKKLVVERTPWQPGIRAWPWPQGQRGRILVTQVRYNLFRMPDGHWVKGYSDHPIPDGVTTVWGLRRGDGILIEGVDTML